MKFCRRCETWKKPEEFHRDRARKDGRHPYCAQCQTKKAAEWCRENRERANANARSYRRTNAEKHKRNQRNYAQRYPEKLRARATANRALKRGIIRKPKRCSGCKKMNVRIQMHHSDYGAPLKIVWLCPKCHSAADREGH